MYPNTLRDLKARLMERFPGLVPSDNDNRAPEPFVHHIEGESREEYELRRQKYKRKIASYLLWMCDTLEAETDRGKKSRWLGWVLAVAERELGLLTNDESRALVRSDK